MSVNFIIIYPPPSLHPDSPAKTMPLGGLYLADALSKAGYSVAILDDGINDIQKTVNGITDNSTVAFGISTLSGTQLKHAIEIAKFLRIHYPHKPIIWGGAHVSALPLQTLESELADFVVWGEGEQSLPKLLNALRDRNDVSQIKGIGYKNRGVPVITENSGYTPLESKIFRLPYKLLNMRKYERSLTIGLKRCFSVFSSRGCPFKCKFCSNSSSVWPNTLMRYHSVEHIANDINILVNEFCADGITFADENIFVNEDRLIEICQMLQRHNFNVKFRTSARADVLSRLHDSTWKMLKDTGFIGISVGIESGSQRILDYIGKGITLEQIYRVDDMLTKYNFFKTFNFMTYIPGETIDDVKKTLSLILYLARSSIYCPYPFAHFHKYIPLPGTELFDIALQHGFKSPSNMEGWVNFDFENVTETIGIVRPWVSDELLRFTSKSIDSVHELNSHYTGNNLDKRAVGLLIQEIEALIDI